ncbi:MAG: hypothetical protein A3H96_23800 [Acidobacteria bacterium RIFCSPLOWO2_02_FULL_67_36]|nr:MAG: hypothetical protein A3H96_23800 [Acidobacteria bacterium RIFCSPLOWO2_02_FULL_67_36]OFW20990.1 MAG: hypothetical protein A3G21_23695 [Acidobacteria bacterium RIFCSPLOWO2_12_FULL_66_21]
MGLDATERRPSALHYAIRAVQGLVACGALAISAIFAYLAIFSRFMPYDDEGTVMVSVRTFLGGLPLYDQTYSQYGPFYYLLKKLLFGVTGGPVTHDITRLTTVVFWMATALLTALFVRRQTKSVNWAIVAFLQVVLHCWWLVAEPGHPQEVLLFLMAAMIAIASLLPGRTAGLALLGALSAFILLTKINSGVYVTLSLALAFLSVSRAGKGTVVAYLLGSVAAVLLPLLVMRAHLDAWALNYALLVSFASAACCLTAWRPALAEPLAIGRAGVAAIAFSGSAALVIGITILLGTTPYALLDGVLLRPLRFATVFAIPLSLDSTSIVCGVASVLLAAAVAWLRLTNRVSGARLGAAGLLAKLAFGLVAAWALMYQPAGALAWVAPFLWVVLLPSSAAPWRIERLFPATVLCFLALLQLLIAYPVAGTQRSWATLLLVPVAVLCLADVTAAIDRRMPRTLGRLAEAAALALVIYVYYPHFDVAAQLRQYQSLMPLSLPGADRIRLSREQATIYQHLTATIRRDCDALVTMPGYNSLHFWTRIKPLTGYNAGAWMILFDDRMQQQIVDRLSQHPNGCVIYDEPGSQIWKVGRDVSGGPLVRYIRESFRTVQTFGDYQLMVRNDRAWSAPQPARVSPGFVQGRPVSLAPDDFFGQPAASLAVSIRTSDHGGVLGCQSAPAQEPASEWVPLLYVDLDGRLSGQFYPGRVETITTREPINDGRWHRVVLMRGGGRQTLFVDGREAGSLASGVVDLHMRHCQLGLAFVKAWPRGTDGWTAFSGDIAAFSAVRRTLTAAEVAADYRDNAQPPPARR